MPRRFFHFALVLIACSFASIAFAQVNPGKAPKPKAGGAQDELEQQLRRILDRVGQLENGMPDQLRDILKEARQQPGPQRKMRPSAVASNARWAGLELKKADTELQQKLGLPDNEGIFVIAVDPNSPADKAGLRANDVIVKINDKAAPSDSSSFANLIKEQKVNAALEIIVVRDGKEETLTAADMPLFVQEAVAPPAGRGGFGGPKRMQQNPFGPGANRGFGGQQNIQMELNAAGVRLSRRMVGDAFSGEYATATLKISVKGVMENGRPKATEITVQDGKEPKKYSDLREVPPQHLSIVYTLMPQTGERLPPPRDLPGIGDK